MLALSYDLRIAQAISLDGYFTVAVKIDQKDILLSLTLVEETCMERDDEEE